MGARDEFQELVAELSRLLGPSSGLDSADVSVEELRKLMEGYVSCEKDCKFTSNLIDDLGFLFRHLMRSHNARYFANSFFQGQKYAFADHSRGYTRNLVDEGNGKSNLVS